MPDSTTPPTTRTDFLALRDLYGDQCELYSKGAPAFYKYFVGAINAVRQISRQEEFLDPHLGVSGQLLDSGYYGIGYAGVIAGLSGPLPIGLAARWCDRWVVPSDSTNSLHLQGYGWHVLDELSRSHTDLFPGAVVVPWKVLGSLSRQVLTRSMSPEEALLAALAVNLPAA